MGGTPSFLVRAAREKADVEGSVRWSACRRWHSSEVAGAEGVSESSHVHLRGRMRSADGISAPVEAEVDQASYFPKAGEAEAERIRFVVGAPQEEDLQRSQETDPAE